MSINEPSEAAIIAAVEWAKAHGTFRACETAEEMFQHAEAWSARPDLIRALVGEHHVAGAGTTYDFVLAPATGELMTPDGRGLTIYVGGIGLVCTVPEWTLSVLREIPEAYLSELTEGLAVARRDPSAAGRLALYLHHRGDVLAAATRARARGIDRPVVLLVDPSDTVGRQFAEGVMGATEAAAVADAVNRGQTPLLLRAYGMAALMDPESPLLGTGRDFLARAAGREGYVPVIVAARGDTSYFSAPSADR